MGEPEKSLRAFQAAVKHESTRPEAERLANLGVCFMRLARFEESTASMQRAMKLMPASDE
eukprot:SAG11_NODE_15098_length_589_cov_0.948980_1_plen_59_part_10